MAIQHAQPAKGRREYDTGFPVRCTEAEKQEIFAMAERVNRSASRFVVELAIAGGDRPASSRPSPEELAALEGLMVQLRRLASNLQEMASRQKGSPADDPHDLSAAEIDDAVLEVRGVLDQLRSRLT